ncbi:hypothetical protein VTK73DRAFT_197 [Phialemonium thermophilum]|uniref:Amidohydrolase 3 domain-containing protein n=1 Tax=Phialemonium thermophilum TaxID=223376 RepID=A0ABR3XFR7_9PEZI
MKDLQTCQRLRLRPVDPIGATRDRNERYVDGHQPTLVRNATVWIGEPDAGGLYSWAPEMDVYLEHGLIKRMGRTGSLSTPSNAAGDDVLVFEAEGRPLTSGLIDMHSHAGVRPLPTLHSNDDVSEFSDSSNIAPYVRSKDGIKPLDHHLQVIKSGGVTSSLVLPGSRNNIGGEAFVVKHAVGPADGRSEISVEDLIADRTWRYMKMAAGENPKSFPNAKGTGTRPMSRLGEGWEFRRAFEEASRLRRRQDDWCSHAESNGLDTLTTYLPFDLQWEPLVAVLRGQVQVHVHCYTIPDLQAFVEHTNEFNFSVTAFHHAHQTYLVPEILRKAWGGRPPASALFADNMWYKAESYVGSEYAGKYLYDSGLVPIYVSDNPVLNAQHLALEAGKGCRYGLPYHAALAAVTSAPAERLGLGEKLGKVKPGFDADVVVWDSDPLTVGAAPVQVWIDGTAQLKNHVRLDKDQFKTPLTPNRDLETVTEHRVSFGGDVVFTGVASNLLPTTTEVNNLRDGQAFNVAVSGGKIICIGECEDELAAATEVVPLKNGHLAPAFTALGSTLGLSVIDSEPDTANGASGASFTRAVDGLALDAENLRTAYRYGVTRAISAPTFSSSSSGTHHGVSTGFLTGASTTITHGGQGVFASDIAVHYTLDLSAKGHGPGAVESMSAAVGRLRQKLLEAVAALSKSTDKGNRRSREDSLSERDFLAKVVLGRIPLAITVHSADTMAALLRLRSDVEEAALRSVLIGSKRRALTGAPLTNGTTVDALKRAGVLTAIGLEEDWVVRDLGLLAGIAYKNGEGRFSRKDALDLVSTNVHKIMGLEVPRYSDHFVIYEGDPLEIDSRVKAVAGGLGTVEVY